MWVISRVIKDFPLFAPSAEALAIGTTDCHIIDNQFVRKIGDSLFSDFLSFKFESTSPGLFRHATTLIKGTGLTYRPVVTFRTDNNITYGLLLHEFGHVCLGYARPESNRASEAEMVGWHFLTEGQRPTASPEEGAEVAAWCGAIILAAVLKFDIRMVLCDLLIGAINDSRKDLQLLFFAMSDFADVVTDADELMNECFINRAEFCAASPDQRCRMIDNSVVEILLMLGEDWL
jgi:hypothetical protein